MSVLQLLTSLTLVFELYVNALPIDKYRQYLTAGTRLELLVQKTNANKPLIDYHSQQMGLPASTMKMVTALAALMQLGPDYRLWTRFDSTVRMEGSTLNGDPTLTRQRLRVMVAALKNMG